MTDTQFFASRRTIRRFDLSRPVETAEITDMLDLARMAPNTGNMQLTSAVITAEPGRRATLAREGHFNQPAASGAAAIVTFCIDTRRFDRWCRLHGTQSSIDNLQGFVWAAIDTAVFAQQFVTIAERRGLGTCYLGTTTYNAGAIARLLNLPGRVLPLISVSIGWPAEEGDPKMRLPLAAIVHSETYSDPSDDELLEIYRPTEEDVAMRRFVAENGVSSAAHLFTQIRYPESGTLPFSEAYLAEIRRAGFRI